MGQQVTHILEQAFPGISIELEEMSNGRLSGTVIWAGFDEQDHGDRQHLVRKVLKEALGARAQEVGVLLTYTPVEMAAMKAA